MKVVILYKPNSETARSVQEYVREFTRQTGRTIELIDAESVKGVELAKVHDIMQFPAILVFKDDGSYISSWVERESWPTVSELSYYK